jgi:DNA-binding NarL/FixJ family response regulator
MESPSYRFVIRSSVRTLLVGALEALVQTVVPGAEVIHEARDDGDFERIEVLLEGTDRWLLVCSDPASPGLATAIVGGAWSILLADASAGEFDYALRSMIDGVHPHLSRNISNLLARHALDRRFRPRGKDRAELTPRERQVIALIFEGASNREIADRLVMSEDTVRTHLQAIYGKPEVQRRLKMLIRAREPGLGEADYNAPP